jgi:hypothetical protein
VGTTEIRVQSGGCYQLDFLGSSTTSLTFRVEPVSSAFERMQRRLDLPGATAAACPASSVSDSETFAGGLVGSGPVYVAGDNHMTIEDTPNPGGFWLERVTWVVAPDELGPVLVRGARIDDRGILGFGAGSEPSAMQQLPIRSYEHTPGQPVGWRIFNGYLRPQTTGCYAMQADTLTGNSTIVFKVN